MAQVERDMQHDIGLPYTYIEVLWRLRRAPGRALRMSDLADATESKASRITHAVGRLEAAGLVRREVSLEDRRGWLAILTDEGMQTAEHAAPCFAESVRRHFLNVLPPLMRDQLTNIGEMLLIHVNAAAPVDADSGS
ncbi:MarR family transcriptional regulator [Streptomyces viridiviolaceus]|nr:MarR family transcriptional regulator [Streptomyces viridiviolaceus]